MYRPPLIDERGVSFDTAYRALPLGPVRGTTQ